MFCVPSSSLDYGPWDFLLSFLLDFLPSIMMPKMPYPDSCNLRVLKTGGSGRKCASFN